MRPLVKLLLIPLLCVLFAGLFYSAYKDVKQSSLKEFNAEQFAMAKQASRGIEGFFIYYQRELQFLSNLNYISDLNDQGKDLLKEFYKSHSDQIEAITIVDSGGILRYTFPYNNSALDQDISTQSHIKQIMQTHKPTVSDVFTTVQGFEAIAYHIPIIKENIYKGSIAILIPLENLGRRYIENIKTKETGFGWLISEKEIILYHPVAVATGKMAHEIYGVTQDLNDLIKRIKNESEGTSVCSIKYSSENDNKQVSTLIAFYRVSLGNTFWTIFISTPEQEIYKTLKSFRNRLYILSLVITGVVFTFFYLSLKANAVLMEEKKRKALEKVISESEKRFRVIFELSPAGIILIDKNGTIIEVNSAFCETLGYSRIEVIGNNIRLFAAPEDKGEIEQNIQNILSGKTLKHEVNNFRKDGTTCVVSIYETMILLPDGQTGILSVSNDITEKKKAQTELIAAKEKAEESDRLKSAFLANISHELRTPLNAIMGFSNLIAESSTDEETVNNSNIIYRSGQHLLSLVEDMFDTAIIETGQIKIYNEKTDIVAVMDEVKDIIHGEILKEEKSGIILNLNLTNKPDYQYVITDGRKVKQVLINLLRNALKFTDHGYIEFGFSKPDKQQESMLQFFVKDTGIGIEKKDQEVIFNTFRQLDDSHSRKFGGMGIGLSISKKLIEKMGGNIWIVSEKGEGSEFLFTIPLLKPDS